MAEICSINGPNWHRKLPEIGQKWAKIESRMDQKMNQKLDKKLETENSLKLDQIWSKIGSKLSQK